MTRRQLRAGLGRRGNDDSGQGLQGTAGPVGRARSEDNVPVGLQLFARRSRGWRSDDAERDADHAHRDEPASHRHGRNPVRTVNGTVWRQRPETVMKRQLSPSPRRLVNISDLATCDERSFPPSPASALVTVTAGAPASSRSLKEHRHSARKPSSRTGEPGPPTATPRVAAQ
jgi:hypothetical protein